MSHELIINLFPELSNNQREQFKELKSLYEFWNAQINVISRKDEGNFYERHVLHSLSIAKIITFKDKSSILDIGTGGGFPGIPLAILFPECRFTLVDSIGKKIKVVREVSKAIGLTNVDAVQTRAEEINDHFDFIVSRAVTSMPQFLKWTRGKFSKINTHACPNGVFYLKGGNLTDELKGIKGVVSYPISSVFQGEFFKTKYVIYVPGN
jgi:16S rRNA (guanine527-N7)-methyltransferase